MSNNLEELVWMRTPSSLNVVYEGQLVQIARNTERCKRIEALIKRGGQKAKILEELFPAKKIAGYSKGEFELKATGDIVEAKTQQVLPKPIAKKLTDFVKAGLPRTAISKFWKIFH